MSERESLEDFYKRKLDWMPGTIKNGIGHFNLFPLEPIQNGKKKPLPYRRRDYYKVMLLIGKVDFHYANQVVSTQEQALVFSNPHIPYKVEHLERIKGGCYCIFNQQFFHQFGNIHQYPVFQPVGQHVFELTNEQTSHIEVIFSKMTKELNSDYIFKYDLLRNLVFELLHFAMKLQ
ncbi:MAG: AraC family transcriptional regulator, partial [Bacteroidota bacterium]